MLVAEKVLLLLVIPLTADTVSHESDEHIYILYTEESEQVLLTKEARSCAVFDSAVCGKIRAEEYSDSLGPDDRSKVVKLPHVKTFKFRGNAVLKSVGEHIILVALVGKDVSIKGRRDIFRVFHVFRFRLLVINVCLKLFLIREQNNNNHIHIITSLGMMTIISTHIQSTLLISACPMPCVNKDL